MYYAAIVDEDKCSGCKNCILTCPDPGVLALSADDRTVRVDTRRCKGCGLCVVSCRRDAITVDTV